MFNPFIVTRFFFICIERACQLDNCSSFFFLDGNIRSWSIFVGVWIFGLLLLNKQLKQLYQPISAYNLKPSQAIVTRLFIRVFRTKSCLHSYLFKADFLLLEDRFKLLYTHTKRLVVFKRL